jgi:hypothetical protein
MSTVNSAEDRRRRRVVAACARARTAGRRGAVRQVREMEAAARVVQRLVAAGAVRGLPELRWLITVMPEPVGVLVEGRVDPSCGDPLVTFESWVLAAGVSEVAREPAEGDPRVLELTGCRNIGPVLLLLEATHRWARS